LNSKIHCNKISTPEKPVKNINNILQRIKKKKQLLAKEILVETNASTKKLTTVPSVPKTVPIPNRCESSNDVIQDIPFNYVKLPDSFYNSQLNILKEHILKEKNNHVSKLNNSINIDLIRYINMLLKMTPSEVDNLSTSSCSSVQLEESILQKSKKNSQYYRDLLNCISKCLNSDISTISQDNAFDSPKNVKLINRLQDLTNYYLEKTNEMKNICDEFPQILNDQNIHTKTDDIKE